MDVILRRIRRSGRRFALLGIVLACVPLASAQRVANAFVTGAAQAAYDNWQTGLRALVESDRDAAEDALAALVDADVSALRVALMADRAIRRNENGGGVLLLEEDALSSALGKNGQRIAELLLVGREQLNQADDGFFFASVGRFDVSLANFEALLDSDVDAVALLEFVNQQQRRRAMLVRLSDHVEMSDIVRAVSMKLAEGESTVKADPVRIKQNINELAGPPRAFDNALMHLKDSGEYAVPFMLAAIRDSRDSALARPLLRALPQLDRPALNPLVIALKSEHPSTQQIAIDALSQIGYAQAIPYLLALRDDDGTNDAVRSAASSAVNELASKAGGSFASGTSAAEAFYRLAENYYQDVESIRADSRLPTANVWFMRDELLINIAVPTQIFNEVMAMRACEEALMHAPDHKPSLALWIAANLRRAAQLGPEGIDDTRPDNDPGALFYAQTGGAEAAQMALSWAIANREAAVALGTIEALRRTAGVASLIGGGESGQPLVEALRFPDRIVRIRAAFALAAAQPREAFDGMQNLLPVMGEALQLSGGSRRALVVDGDTESANGTAAALRELGYEAVIDSSLFVGLDKVRNEVTGVDLITLASDLADPGLESALAELREEFRFAATPILIVQKEGDAARVRALTRSDRAVGHLSPDVAVDAVRRIVERTAQAAGATAVTPDIGQSVALEAAELLAGIAASDSPVVAVMTLENTLLTVVESDDFTLRAAVGRVLALLPSSAGQETLAKFGLSKDGSVEQRIVMLDLLALSGRRNGTMLEQSSIDGLLDAATQEDDLDLREAVSRALGALSLPGNPASTLVRKQHRG